MGVFADVVVFVGGGIDAINSLNAGSTGGGPIGAVGQVLSTAGAGAQAIGRIVLASPITGVIANGTGLAGNALTAVQLTIDLNDGQSIKVGDAVSIGVGIPVGIAVATGATALSSVLIPVAAFGAFAGAALNIAGITTDDLFKLLDRLDGTPNNAPFDRTAVEAAIKTALPLSSNVGDVPAVAFTRLGANAISESCNRNYTSALNWTAPRDPLVLDLDGDGIEAVGINPANPVTFDHDADGLRTGTGWIKADDCLVVLDLNGNGLIDTGRELFGDNTLLPNGETASNGYQALAQHDSNGDGRINSQDAIYTQLRVWQDANQDGISQANELKTLAQVGIASINTAGAATNINLGNGNSQPFSGSFTRTDGSAGASGVAELSGSLLLAANNFYRTFTDGPAATTAAQALPEMRGSGAVRDLREEMNFSAPKAKGLRTKLNFQESLSSYSANGYFETQVVTNTTGVLYA